VKATIIGSRVRESRCQSSAEDTKGHGYLSRHLRVGTAAAIASTIHSQSPRTISHIIGSAMDTRLWHEGSSKDPPRSIVCGGPRDGIY
jgi:hypothetical protein